MQVKKKETEELGVEKVREMNLIQPTIQKTKGLNKNHSLNKAYNSHIGEIIWKYKKKKNLLKTLSLQSRLKIQEGRNCQVIPYVFFFYLISPELL